MKPMHFSIAIAAPKEKVWNTMLQQETYRIWTAEFGEGGYYEGSWEQGEKIRFLGPGGTGGMTSVIAENKPWRFISIKHLGIIKNGIDDTESEEAKAWSHVYENYTFEEKDGITEVQVDMSAIPQEFDDYMTNTWPKALAKLKALCEQHI
ncbi:MAG: SRPBCC domain-containing protein [Sideroxyarcus sp.]|nr:SRPBCC domain-containing protein [Sideroxyarcus sp.]